MFNTIVHRHESAPRYPQQIHEHKAPTDESLRMLQEMQQKAEKSILERGKIECNDLRANWIIQQGCFGIHGHDNLIVHLHLRLNAKEFRWDFQVCPSRWTSPREKFIMIRDELAKKIANECVEKLLENPMNLKIISTPQ